MSQDLALESMWHEIMPRGCAPEALVGANQREGYQWIKQVQREYFAYRVENYKRRNNIEVAKEEPTKGTPPSGSRLSNPANEGSGPQGLTNMTELTANFHKVLSDAEDFLRMSSERIEGNNRKAAVRETANLKQGSSPLDHIELLKGQYQQMNNSLERHIEAQDSHTQTIEAEIARSWKGKRGTSGSPTR